uniref:receptor protein-tyrosine kinase n=1 Tax=Globodera rostochiensis TaxID=31243 RepID=A0A914HVK6_GLORO
MRLSPILLLLLLSFSNLYSTRALKVNLLDTLSATSELNWRTYSNLDEKDGWLEETSFSRAENRNHQVYSTCNQEPDFMVENWLLIPAVERGQALRLYLDFNFTIIRCAAVPLMRTSSCKETLKLYAVQLEKDETLPTLHWHNETKWDYVDTLVSHSTDTGMPSPTDAEKTYTQTSSYTVTRHSVHFALRNTGACSSILSVKIYYNVCPEQTSTPHLLQLPRTVTSRDAHGVVSVPGRCASNASPIMLNVAEGKARHRHPSPPQPAFSSPSLSPPTAICKADGTWQVLGSTECACDPGHTPSQKSGLCIACGPGTYKSVSGVEECRACAGHSHSNRSASTECECIGGYHRPTDAGPDAPCIKVADQTFDHLSSIQTSVGNGEVDLGDGRNQRETPSTQKDDWLSLLSSVSAWPWVLVFAVIIASFCLLLILATRQQNNGGRKQMSDLDVLDNYKQDTISPDYSRSLAGLPSGGGGGIGISGCLSGQNTNSGTFLRRKMHTPLIRGGPTCYGTHQRSAGGAAVMVSSSHGANHLPLRVPLREEQSKMYVDPMTYADPSEVLAEFTNEICAASIEVTRTIGAGEFGEVCCGRLTVEDHYGHKQQQIVAVKTLLPGSGFKAKADFLMEASIMGQFEHENVIHLIGVVTKTEPVMILTEYMLYGSLDQFLRSNSNGKLSICQMIKLLQGIASGMKYLNDKGYVHRDLAARNVLVDDRLTCKIADFGLSRGLRKCVSGNACDGCESFEQQGEYTTQQGGKIPIRWTAPEAIMQHKYTTASDVWSFGVVMWEVMSFGERPYWDWTNHRVIQEVVHNGFRLPSPQDTPKRLYEMMLACWQAERHKRPTFADLLEQLNAFLNNIDFFYKYI